MHVCTHVYANVFSPPFKPNPSHKHNNSAALLLHTTTSTTPSTTSTNHDDATALRQQFLALQAEVKARLTSLLQGRVAVYRQVLARLSRIQLRLLGRM